MFGTATVSSLGYMLLLNDSLVAEVPIYDSREALVESRFGGLVRSGLEERLVAAAHLLDDGIQLRVNEGYRSATAQQRIITEYSAAVQAKNPEMNPKDVLKVVSQFVAPMEVAPHVAGAAVDVTLVDHLGNDLWMGTEIDESPLESGGRCFTDASVDPVARANRETLKRVLTTVGLVNYPTEWWHWSFGDRYWAIISGKAHAIYGPVDDCDDQR